MATGQSWVFGFLPFVLIQLTILMVGGAAGVWLFYVQHQFDDAYWERRDHWNYTAAALQGSSFYELPRLLQWLSGNIGFHHIHHLSPRIPNYNLERCHRSHPLFRGVKPITLCSGFRATRYRLWDERRRQLVGFRHLEGIRAPVGREEERDVSIDASRAERPDTGGSIKRCGSEGTPGT